jgi:hypothetical protein
MSELFFFAWWCFFAAARCASTMASTSTSTSTADFDFDFDF